MRAPLQWGLMVVGIGVIGYAFYMLGASKPEPSDAERPDKAVRSKTKERRVRRPGAKAPSRRGGPAGVGSRSPSDPATRAEPDDSARPKGPPSPKPDISLAEARENFENIMVELTRLENQGIRVESDKWVDYYKRGNDALLPLQQHLDWSVPAEAAELRKANEDLRNKLSKIEPLPVPPS